VFIAVVRLPAARPRVFFQDGGFYSCLERIAVVVSGVRWLSATTSDVDSGSQAVPTQTVCHGTAPC